MKVKVLISADVGNITGIFRKSQVAPDRPDYGQLRSLMIHDVNTTIHGASAEGATEVVVNDSHNYDDNILLVGLDPRASLMSGTDKPLIMAEGLTEQVDALMLVGYHSRRGTKSVISRTYYYPTVADVAVNGVPFEEAEFVSHVAGYYGVPTVLLAENDYVTASVEKQVPGIHMTVVKKVIGSGDAQLCHLEKTGKLIEEAAKAAVNGYQTMTPIRPEGPMTLTITSAAATQTIHACKVPGFTLSKGQDNVISYICDDYLELYKAFLGALWQVAAFSDQCQFTKNRKQKISL